MSKNWSDWDLNHWLTVLENRHKEEIKLGLTRIRAIAQSLDLLNPKSQVITVAGTNGKGSTVSALETLYQGAGYKVGAYTSPHLLRYNERIRMNLEPIPDDALCQAFRLIEKARGSVTLSYFETTTLAALWYFKEHAMDLMILEVGLGGRLDATNIIDADLSIISTIDFDHQEFLGDTLEAIGFEKAGILREGKPFIYADNNPPASIIKQAERLHCPSYFYDNEYAFVENARDWVFTGLGHSLTLPKPHIQLKAASAAIMASFLLNEVLPLSYAHRVDAMTKISIPGRLQLCPGDVSVLFDVSHNPQSARLLAKHLLTLGVKGKIHAVFSALKDKDIFGLILPLKDCVDNWYPAQLDYKRAASAEEILSNLRQAEIISNFCYNSPLIAFNAARSQSKSGDLIVVFGSFFTVSHVMSAEYSTLMRKEI